MATEKMYDLAFQYKKTKLWKKLYDSELFAVRLSDGKTGYCCVMGEMGELVALSLYVGEEGYESYRDIAFRDEEDDENDADWFLRQSCLQCSFEGKEDLDESAFREARNYTRSHGIRTRGEHAWPKFMKYMRYRIPWDIQSKTDQQRMCDALSAAIALAGFLEEHEKMDLGVFPVEEDTETLPLLIPKERGYVISRTEVPEPWLEAWPEPSPLAPERVEQIRKLKKKGVYACELLRIPGLLPGQLEECDDAPWFPVILLCADIRNPRIFATDAIVDYDEHPDLVRNQFLDALIESGECPRAVKARNEQTRVLLEDFCVKANVLLTVDENLPALDFLREEALGALHANDDGDELEYDSDDMDDDMDPNESFFQVIDELSRMSDRNLKAIPKDIVRQILDMAYFGFVPNELQLRLRRLFKL